MITYQQLKQRGYEHSSQAIMCKNLDSTTTLFYDFIAKEGGLVLFTKDECNTDFVELIFNFESVEQMDAIEQSYSHYDIPTSFGKPTVTIIQN